MADDSSNYPSSPDANPASDVAIGPQHAATAASNRSKDRKKGKFASSTAVERSDAAAEDQLVDRTKQQIRTLVNEITQLAKSNCSVEDFYQGFLTRTTGALASEGGAIWIRPTVEEPLQLIYHINLKNTVLATDPLAQRQHSALLKKIADAVIVNNQTIGLVEILQRPGAGPTTQRGYLRFLMQMCDIASDFLTNEKIRSFASQQTMWSKFEQYIKSVHNGLDIKQTAYVVANEGRRVIDCDRVSVVRSNV